MTMTLLVPIVLAGAYSNTKAAIVQAVLNAPKLQLHYYKTYLIGNKRIQIVTKILPSGTRLKLFNITFQTVSKIETKLRDKGLYISIDSIKKDGDQAAVTGSFRHKASIST